MTQYELVSRQRRYYLTGATKDYEFRIAALKKLEKAVRKNKTALAEALKKDLNKDGPEAYMTEIGLVLKEIKYHRRHLRRWMRNRWIPTPLYLFPSGSRSYPEPCGVVLIMGPWNYPVNLTLIPLVGAISGGNCAVVKPSEQTAATSELLCKILADTFPPDYIAPFSGSHEETDGLLEQKFDHIFFTGNAGVGRRVMEAAAAHLTPVTLELGGKSPAVIDKTADVRAAAKRIAFGKTVNAGQTCVAPDYLLIDESVRDEFIAYFKEAIEQFFPDGDYSAMPRIINDRQFERILNLMSPEEIAFGGTYNRESRFIEPTLLVDITEKSPCMQQEVFGPVLPVITFSDMSEVIDFINQRSRPIALYLFTQNKDNEKRVIGNCSFGGGCINDAIVHASTVYLPFGGTGASGIGSYHGKKSFDTFTHERSVIRSSPKFEMSVRYRPYGRIKKFLLNLFLG